MRVLVDYPGPEGMRCEYATTLGAGGLFIESDEPLPAGSLVKVRFRLPGREPLHEIEGRVVWAHGAGRDPAGKSPGMGVAFLDAQATAELARSLETESRIRR